jgi:hypothetical protein
MPITITTALVLESPLFLRYSAHFYAQIGSHLNFLETLHGISAWAVTAFPYLALSAHLGSLGALWWPWQL